MIDFHENLFDFNFVLYYLKNDISKFRYADFMSALIRKIEINHR